MTPLALGAPSEAQDAAPRGTPAQPNVLVVMTDDQRASDLATAMPLTERRVARKGVSFDQAWATFPLCCPSRATNLTGQYAHNHGVLANVPPDGGEQAFDDSTTTAVALDAAGYRTGLIGKYLNGYYLRAQEDPPYEPSGWDEWLGMANPGQMYGWAQVVRGEIRVWGANREPREYQTDVLARQADRFVKSSLAGDDPFFLTVTPLAPHGERRSLSAKVNPRPAGRHRHAFEDQRFPRTEAFNEADVADKPSWLQATPRLDRTERRRFISRYRDRLASLLAVDELVERLVLTIRDAGALKDTLIVFTSDNGFLLGEHRLRGKNVAYREAAQVPLLMRGLGLPKGAEVDAPVGNIDVAATIYDATGVEPPLEQDGVSLFDVVADPAEYSDRELLIQTTKSIGLRTADFLYVEHDLESGPEFELYDTAEDPLELESVHDDPAYAVVHAQLAQRLDQLRDCQGNGCH